MRKTGAGPQVLDPLPHPQKEEQAETCIIIIITDLEAAGEEV
jgi:hypothetical protein